MQNLIKKINERYPTLKAVCISEWDNREDANGIWFKGTENTWINDTPVLNMYGEVNESLELFLESLGLFAEPYDSCTLMAYKA